jgi:hypothetical protein
VPILGPDLSFRQEETWVLRLAASIERAQRGILIWVFVLAAIM